jgi:hypothetical protein
MQEFCDSIKRPNLQIMDIEEGEEVQAKSIHNVFNKIIENFPNLKKEMPIWVQETSRTPNRHDQNRTSPWHIIIKTTSTGSKERMLKVIGEKNQITYKDKPIKTTVDFSIQTLKPRRAGSEILRALKETNFSSRILKPAKVLFKIGGGIKTFQDFQKLKQYMITKPPLQKILKGILHTLDGNKHSHNDGKH